MSLLQNKEILQIQQLIHALPPIRYIHVPHLFEADEKNHIVQKLLLHFCQQYFRE